MRLMKIRILCANKSGIMESVEMLDIQESNTTVTTVKMKGSYKYVYQAFLQDCFKNCRCYHIISYFLNTHFKVTSNKHYKSDKNKMTKIYKVSRLEEMHIVNKISCTLASISYLCIMYAHVNGNNRL